jgi:hypothetical protein
MDKMSKWMSVGPADEKSGYSSFFGISLPFRRSSHAPAAPAPSRMSVSQIKLQAELCFQDVDGIQSDRLRLKIRCAMEVRDLWLLRSDILQLLAQHFNQAEASKRINSLLPCFEGWLPERQLVKI